MLQLNYTTHLLLNSKYRLFINLAVIFIFYSLLYGNKIIFCMNDNTAPIEAPIVAESKESVRPSHQILALKNNIINYLDPQDDLVKELTSLNGNIIFKTRHVEFLEKKKLWLEEELKRLDYSYPGLESSDDESISSNSSIPLVEYKPSDISDRMKEAIRKRQEKMKL